MPAAMEQLKYERAHYAMDLLKRSNDIPVLVRGARVFLNRKLPDAAAELLEKAANLAENAGDGEKARTLYLEAGRAAIAYKRPDWAQEMFDKAQEHQEGARVLSLNGWKAWGAFLLRQGGFHEQAERMELNASKSDKTARNNWIEAKRLEKEAKKRKIPKGEVDAMKQQIPLHFKAAARASARLRIHPLYPFSTMQFAMGGDIDRSIDHAIRSKRPDWLIPIADLFDAPKPQIARWADRVAKLGKPVIEAQLREMAGQYVKGAEAAGRAGMPLWEARLREKAAEPRAK